ncbi:MAG: EAL domain-containing protein, partial [Ilumatobacteraceae bacterium]
TLASLRRLGVSLAIDDFGTGYSSLSYLDRFPVNIVKIDRSFVSLVGVDEDRRKSALVAAIVAMAGALDLGVVAEGIETREQLTALQRLGVHRGQGFFFGRPMPAAALTELVADNHRWNVAQQRVATST